MVLPGRKAAIRENDNEDSFVVLDQQGIADTIIYDGQAKEVIMEGNARFKENDKRATANRMVYEETTEMTRMEGNAIYDSENQHIESELILYDQKNGTYITQSRSTVYDGAQILQADSINFNDEAGTGYAEGNVIWVDTAEQITIVCEEADYNKETDYLLASGGRPLLIRLISDDSLFMRSDTLISLIQTIAIIQGG